MKSAPHRRPALESLESRQLLSTVFTGGVLNIGIGPPVLYLFPPPVAVILPPLNSPLQVAPSVPLTLPASLSGSVTLVVPSAGTSPVTLSVTPSALTLAPTDSLTLAISVTAPSGTPTGQVHFIPFDATPNGIIGSINGQITCDYSASQTATLVNGSATFTIPANATFPRATLYDVIYDGDSSFAPQAAPPVIVTCPASTALALATPYGDTGSVRANPVLQARFLDAQGQPLGTVGTGPTPFLSFNTTLTSYVPQPVVYTGSSGSGSTTYASGGTLTLGGIINGGIFKAGWGPVITGPQTYYFGSASSSHYLTLVGNYTGAIHDILTNVPPASTPITGTVSFYEGAQLLGQVDAACAVATFVPTGLALGDHTITAVYQGSGLYTSSTASTTVHIAPNTTSTALTLDAATIKQGDTFTLTANTRTAYGDTVSPTGTVAFYDDTTLLATVSAGQKLTVTTPLDAGSHSLSAVYSGDANFPGSTSASVTLDVIANPLYVPAPPAAPADLPVLPPVAPPVLTPVAPPVLAPADVPVIPALPITFDPHFFNEPYYLSHNPDVAAAVNAGQFTSGYDHYLRAGAAEGRCPCPYFDERFYLESNADVAAAVAAGQFRSGWQHYIEFGLRELRNPAAFFDEVFYRQHNPDVAAAIAEGKIASGLAHFIATGLREGRLPAPAFAGFMVPDIPSATAQSAIPETPYFNESFYLAGNPDVAAAVAAGQFNSGYEHFIIFGRLEGRAPTAAFNPTHYLALNPDVAAAVQSHIFASAWDHYIRNGRFENRAV